MWIRAVQRRACVCGRRSPDRKTAPAMRGAVFYLLLEVVFVVFVVRIG
jgi:hypothetical protein